MVARNGSRSGRAPTGRGGFGSTPCLRATSPWGRQPFHSLDIRTTVQAPPGETVRLVVGGDGETVTGRIVIPGFRPSFDVSHSTGQLKRQQEHPVALPPPRRNDYPDKDTLQAAMNENGRQRLLDWRSDTGAPGRLPQTDCRGRSRSRTNRNRNWRSWRQWVKWQSLPGTK
jgi:hypothetical protein